MKYIDINLEDKKYLTEMLKENLKLIKNDTQRSIEHFDKLLKIIISLEIEISKESIKLPASTD